MRAAVACVVLASVAGIVAAGQTLPPADPRPPILDMHLHALAADAQGPPPMAMCAPFFPFPPWDPARPYHEVFMHRFKQPPCADPVWSPETDEEIMTQTTEAMERLNIFGVVSGDPDRVAAWMKAAPKRLLPGIILVPGDSRTGHPVESLRALHRDGRLAVLGEIASQYAGIAPDDERMEPYWALAEELDIPAGIHIGPGPPGVIYLGSEGYRARLHSPLTLEAVLVKHRRLRVYIMHAGFPMLDDLLALMYAHPQVYVDVGVIVYTQPRPAFYRHLRGIVEAGFGNRVMFGSDQMVWPGVIERAVSVIEDAPFLGQEQKRDILYNNAARFLRLGEAEIARHHGM